MRWTTSQARLGLFFGVDVLDNDGKLSRFVIDQLALRHVLVARREEGLSVWQTSIRTAGLCGRVAVGGTDRADEEDGGKGKNEGDEEAQSELSKWAEVAPQSTKA